MKRILVSAILLCIASPVWAAPTVRICLPERFRLLTNQLFDLRVEAADLAGIGATIRVTANGNTLASVPEVTIDNDSQPGSLDKAWTFRNVRFPYPGVWKVEVTVNDGGPTRVSTRIGVQEFSIRGEKKNIILYIGDAMGTTYRDAGRIVGKSVDHGFREGFFDELQQMDRMPVSGMVMTYALDRVVPDSANAATAWASGSKTVEGALNVFPDNNDFKFSAANVQGTKQFALDNPRVETLWEYLRRLYGYRTGIVTTSDVTDATPAGEGGHTITRNLLFDIARQYVDGVFMGGPAFDVIMGGGKEKFDARTIANSGDARNLVSELQAKGFTYVETRTALNGLAEGGAAPARLLGLFRTSHMNVAYDKLGLVRPPDEPPPNFGGFADQPFLDEMTDKAIAVLTKGGKPFILMVEGASIDKQSHPNHAAGTIWDTIEFDKAIGVGRAFARGDHDNHDFGSGRFDGRNSGSDTLVLVSADHDQSMHIIGLADTDVPGAVTNTRSNSPYPVTATLPPAPAGGANVGEVAGFPDYEDTDHDGYPENVNRYRIAVAFRTGNHTGSTVPITAEGPGALFFTGYFDQTDIFFKMARALSIDTDRLDDVLEIKKHLDILGPNY